MGRSSERPIYVTIDFLLSAATKHGRLRRLTRRTFALIWPWPPGPPRPCGWRGHEDHPPFYGDPARHLAMLRL